MALIPGGKITVAPTSMSRINKMMKLAIVLVVLTAVCGTYSIPNNRFYVRSVESETIFASLYNGMCVEHDAEAQWMRPIGKISVASQGIAMQETASVACQLYNGIQFINGEALHMGRTPRLSELNAMLTQANWDWNKVNLCFAVYDDWWQVSELFSCKLLVHFHASWLLSSFCRLITVWTP